MVRASQQDRAAAMAKLCMVWAFGVSLCGCIPELPAPDAHERRLAQVQTERAIAILPGVRRAAVTATAAVVTVNATAADVTAIAGDVVRVTGLPTTAIVVLREPATTVLLRMGPWTLAEKSRWPLVGTAITILGLVASVAGYLAWRMRPRPQR
jgi:hypothetical protein